MFSSKVFLIFLLFLNKYCCYVSVSKGKTGTAIHSTSNRLLEEYKEGNYNIPLGQHFGVFNSLMRPKGTITVQLIPGYDNCLGLLTSANEAIVLKCHEKQNEVPGCFDIINLSSTENRGLLPTDKENRVCVSQPSDPFEHCVGLKIKDNSTIILACPIRPYSVTFVKNNGEPPRL